MLVDSKDAEKMLQGLLFWSTVLLSDLCQDLKPFKDENWQCLSEGPRNLIL